jgi:hypothetical protein
MTKHASEMDDAEIESWLKAHAKKTRDAALAELKAGPMSTGKSAKEMTDAERAAWLRDHKQRFG